MAKTHKWPDKKKRVFAPLVYCFGRILFRCSDLDSMEYSYTFIPFCIVRVSRRKLALGANSIGQRSSEGLLNIASMSEN